MTSPARLFPSHRLNSANPTRDSVLSMLDGSPHFHDAAEALAGYGELVAAVQRLEQHPVLVATFRDEGRDAAAATAVLDGADPTEVAEAELVAEHHAEVRRRAYVLTDTALKQAWQRAETWIAANEPAIAAALTAGLERRRLKMRALLDGPVAGVRSAEDLVRQPEAAPDYARLVALAEEVISITTLAKVRVRSLAPEFHLLWMIEPSTYPSAWPGYWRSTALVLAHTRTGQFLGELAAEAPPWPHDNRDTHGATVDTVRWLAAQDVRFWWPTGRAFEDAARMHAERTAESRDEAAEAATAELDGMHAQALRA